MAPVSGYWCYIAKLGMIGSIYEGPLIDIIVRFLALTVYACQIWQYGLVVE